MKKNTKTDDKCPKCGGPHNDATDQIVSCPECQADGSTACCNPGGVNCLCADCENAEDE